MYKQAKVRLSLRLLGLNSYSIENQFKILQC